MFGKDNDQKPFGFGKYLQAWDVALIKEFNSHLENFIKESSVRCVAGAPYYNTVLPGKPPIPAGVFQDGETTENYIIDSDE